jgi:hypothetical protein
MDNDNELNFNTRLSTINAFANSERSAKEQLIDEMQSAVNDLRAFISRVCTENEKPVPVMREDLRLGQMLSIALGTFQLLMAELRMRTESHDDSNIKTLSETNKQLLKDKNSLEVQIEALKSRVKVLESAADAFGSSSSHHPTKSIVEENADIKTQNYPIQMDDQFPLSARRILDLAGASSLYRIEDLVDECVTKLSITTQEAEEHLALLEKEGLLETIKTPTKPIPGTRFPVLFYLTERGIRYSGSDHQPETLRLLQNISGMTEGELPVFVFAVEDYLPKHGYIFVTYLSANKYMDEENNPREFISHAKMQGPDGNIVYIMYEGDGFRNGDYIKGYLRDYSIISDRVAYFLCPSGRMVEILQGKVNYLTHNEKLFSRVHISNIGDWAAYDKMIKAGDKDTPDSIWFGKLFTKGK